MTDTDAEGLLSMKANSIFYALTTIVCIFDQCFCLKHTFKKAVQVASRNIFKYIFPYLRLGKLTSQFTFPLKT